VLKTQLACWVRSFLNGFMESAHIRPNIEDCSSSDEFRRWYYLKSELVDFAKTNGIPSNVGKFEIADRIAAVLNSEPLPQPTKLSPQSRFDWANATLTPNMHITDNVSFGPNVRGFFKAHIGPAFVCNSDFMDWVRHHVGVSLSDAVDAWKMLEARKTDPDFQTRIRSHNQYNQFTRDILAANPQLSLEAVRQIWKAKRALPRPMTYQPSDLSLL
jgi:Domain of unknown function (DUF6434)/SAP domain-containing new25